MIFQKSEDMIFQKSEDRGSIFSCKNVNGKVVYALFSFVMMYGLSSNKAQYSTSNIF